jgi:DNA polymerase I-like protein with 3'-5' exonuclease and polymerase domains
MDAIVDLEARTFPAMVDMSINGFPADVDVAREMSERYGKEANTALAKLEELTPKDGWNFNSDDQKREILNLLGVEFPSKYPKTAQKKEPSMAGAALKTLKKPRAAVRWVEAYLEYESLRKLSGDFVTKYASIVRPDGTIKGSFDTISTGRFSCRRPNLQQVPKRGKLQKTEGMRIRDVFRPLAGDVFVITDFAQLELLLAATIAARETSREGRMLGSSRRPRSTSTAPPRRRCSARSPRRLPRPSAPSRRPSTSAYSTGRRPRGSRRTRRTTTGST